MRTNIQKLRETVKTRPLVCMTSYTANIASIVDEFADIILVGDSISMIVYGNQSTIPVTLETMVLHTKAVVNATQNAFVVLDMPFGSYEASPEKAFESVSFAIKNSGCSAVKMEGGIELAKTVEFLTQRGILVVGHVGLMPQRVASYGGYKKHTDTQTITRDFEAIHNAGAFATVLENTSQDVTNEVLKIDQSAITIGIGAGTRHKGYIAVTEDLLGLSQKSPPFYKQYMNGKELIKKALREFSEDSSHHFTSRNSMYNLLN